MMLFLTAFDRQANVRKFSCYLHSIEATFDFLNRVVSRGDTLLDAHLVDRGSRIDLPLAAFDGIPISPGIQALQQEWQAILNEPRQEATWVRQEEIIELIRQRIRQCEVNIGTHERMIDWFSQWLQRTQDGCTSEVLEDTLVRYYESSLNHHHQQLKKAKFRHELVTSRLSQMLAWL